MNETKNILEVEDLKTYFYCEEGLAKAVDGVSFTLKEEETLGIIGESGSGKTVTADSIMRLVQRPYGRIVSGKIFFNGKDLLKLSDREIIKIRGSKISMIFQNPAESFNPVYTIGKQLVEAIIIHKKINKKEAKSKVIDLLEIVGISRSKERFNQYPHEFSGGMLQRAMIAMALLCEPKILIADEPTTALDVTTQTQVLELIKKIKKDYKMSVIIISHDMGVIVDTANKICVMYAGKIMEYSDVNTILLKPSHPYTRALLKSIPKITDREKLVQIDGNPPYIFKIPKGCSFSPRCKFAKKICFEETPEIRLINVDHKIACHFNLNLNNKT